MYILHPTNVFLCRSGPTPQPTHPIPPQATHTTLHTPHPTALHPTHTPHGHPMSQPHLIPRPTHSTHPVPPLTPYHSLLYNPTPPAPSRPIPAPPPPTPIPLHITPAPGPPSRSKGSLGATCASWTCARSINLARFSLPQSWTAVAIIRDHHSHHHPPRPQGAKSIKLHPRTPTTNPSHKPRTAQPTRRAPTP